MQSKNIVIAIILLIVVALWSYYVWLKFANTDETSAAEVYYIGQSSDVILLEKIENTLLEKVKTKDDIVKYQEIIVTLYKRFDAKWWKDAKKMVYLLWHASQFLNILHQNFLSAPEEHVMITNWIINSFLRVKKYRQILRKNQRINFKNWSKKWGG